MRRSEMRELLDDATEARRRCGGEVRAEPSALVVVVVVFAEESSEDDPDEPNGVTALRSVADARDDVAAFSLCLATAAACCEEQEEPMGDDQSARRLS